MEGLRIEECKDWRVWDDFIDESEQGSIFLKKIFLDIFDIEKKLFFLKKDEKKIIAFPIFLIKTKFIILPFCYYQGLVFSKFINELNYSRKFNWLIYSINYILVYLSKNFKTFQMSLHPSISDIRAFDWFNFKKNDRVTIYPRYTAILDITKIYNMSDFGKKIRKDRRQDLRYAKKDNLEVYEETNFKNVENLINKVAKNKSYLNTNIKTLIKKIIHHVVKFKFGSLIAVKNKKSEIISLQLVVWDSKSGHALLNLNHPKYLSAGISSLIYKEMINICIKKKISFLDLNGANSFNRADFKHSFYTKPQLYFHMSWPNSGRDFYENVEANQ